MSKLFLFALAAAGFALLPGCDISDSDKTPRIENIPESAEILLLSNKDTKGRRKEIYAMNSDGSNLTRITHSDVHHFLVGIDPQKRYLVATRAVEDTNLPAGLGDEDMKSLWVIDLETGEETRLTEEGVHAEGKSFSPDGEWIVFWMQKNSSRASDIYKIRRDGTELIQLTHTEDVYGFDPAWSNDGESIVFTSFDLKIGRSILKSMDSDGGNPRVVFDGGEGIATPLFPAGNYDPSWSPDDNWIVFTRAVSFDSEIGGENTGAGVWNIFKVRSDGTDVKNLSEENTQANAANYLPSFSLDSRHILFSSRHSLPDQEMLPVDIYSMTATGGSAKKLTNSKNAIYFDMGTWIK